MEALKFILSFIVIYFIYFLPAFIAKQKNHPSQKQIWFLNLFFGWSLIGWFIALTMALSSDYHKSNPS